MSFQMLLLGKWLDTLITNILDTFMLILNMSFKIILCCSLMIT